MPLELVIFDCDGVLVDSEPIANRLLADGLTSIGVPMTWQESVALFMGRSAPDCIRIAEDVRGAPLPGGFVEDLAARTRQVFEDELQAVPGIAEALEQIPFLKCLASSSRRVSVRRKLEITGILQHFEERYFSADQVGRGKPHPDLFLYAVECLGVRPESCVVVEDSIPGVEAGVAAGMTVLGYSTLVPASALEEAGARVFTSMEELPALIDSWSG